MNIIDKKFASDLSVNTFKDEWFWKQEDNGFLYDKYFQIGYEHFIDWRIENKKIPVHLCLYDCLTTYQYSWSNLLDSDISLQPYFHLDQKKKLLEIDLIIFGVSFAQIYFENKIDFLLKQTFLRAIERECNSQLLKLFPIRTRKIRKTKLEDLIHSVKAIKIVGIINTNESLFFNYFNSKKNSKKDSI